MTSEFDLLLMTLGLGLLLTGQQKYRILGGGLTPASQILTYTWLLSDAGAANIRKRVEPGVGAQMAGGTQDVTVGTAYCVAANFAGISKES